MNQPAIMQNKKNLKGILNNGQRSKDIQKQEWSSLLHTHTQSLTLKPIDRVHAGLRGREDPVRDRSVRFAQQRHYITCNIPPCIL